MKTKEKNMNKHSQKSTSEVNSSVDNIWFYQNIKKNIKGIFYSFENISKSRIVFQTWPNLILLEIYIFNITKERISDSDENKGRAHNSKN